MVRNTFAFFIIFGLVSLLLSGCATTPKVYSDFDPRVDFTSNKTFTWVHRPPLLQAGDYPVSALAETRMTAAIKGALITMGYEFVEDESNADFSVVYTMGARDKIEIIKYPSGFYNHRYDWGWGAYYFPYFVYFPFNKDGYRHEELNTYTDGNIAIDIFNTNTKKPIFHAKASKRLSKRDLSSDARNAEKIAANLLQHFPEVGCEVEISEQCQPFKQ